MAESTTGPSGGIDTEAFRLRNFVESLAKAGELETHEAPIDLIDMGRVLDGHPRAVLFRKAGQEGAEVVGNVMGSRRRLAAAFGVEPAQLAREMMRRMATPQPAIEIPSKDAPVHQIVLTGDEADFTRLPVHLQHALDGGPYISAGIDFALDPDTGWVNVGSRRLMLMGRRQAGLNLAAPSDLRQLYHDAVARGERLPVSFTVGAHPTDFMAASMRVPVNEIALIGTLRGAPIATVRGVTNHVPVPADAEIVLEGYFDARGYIDPEGPYGETFGYYGVLVNPGLADGQVKGGLAQGIGGGLFEELSYDANGQLMTGSLMDYLLPSASDIPPLTVIHHETPSPLNALGVKGLGEGGAIAPPVVIANAVCDALRPFRAELNTTPVRWGDVAAFFGDDPFEIMEPSGR